MVKYNYQSSNKWSIHILAIAIDITTQITLAKTDQLLYIGLLGYYLQQNSIGLLLYIIIALLVDWKVWLCYMYCKQCRTFGRAKVWWTQNQCYQLQNFLMIFQTVYV